MNFNVSRALSCKSLISNKSCFSETLRFILDETKFTKNELLSIFLIAKEASEGIFGLCLMICKANSFIESIMALNSESADSGIISGTPSIKAFIYGSIEVIFSIVNLFFP